MRRRIDIPDVLRERQFQSIVDQGLETVASLAMLPLCATAFLAHHFTRRTRYVRTPMMRMVTFRLIEDKLWDYD